MNQVPWRTVSVRLDCLPRQPKLEPGEIVCDFVGIPRQVAPFPMESKDGFHVRFPPGDDQDEAATWDDLLCVRQSVLVREGPGRWNVLWTSHLDDASEPLLQVAETFLRGKGNGENAKVHDWLCARSH